jgi:Multiubiquitin
MTTEITQSAPDRKKTIEITIDGRPFTLEDRRYTVAELLGLAGLPASGYDLTRVGKHGHVETFSGDEEIEVKEGDVFVSVNRQGTVA